MAITEAQALTIVSLDSMKTELRIPATETEHDSLLSGQIHSAANLVAQSTGADLGALPAMRAAIVSLTRELYDGRRELAPDSTVFGLMDVFRSYKHSE